jgi:hypothetical protein
LTVCAGSSVDQHTNNISLFNVVEQVNVSSRVQAPPRGVFPLEIHAYWRVAVQEVSETFEARFVLVADSGLETPSSTFVHRPVTSRFRTRTMGVPYPPVFGDYVLYVDWRAREADSWARESVEWPMSVRVAESKPPTRH